MTAAPSAPPLPSVQVALFPTTPGTSLVHATAPGVPEFSCVAERQPDGSVLLADFRPHREDPRAAALLPVVAQRVAEEYGVAAVAAVHPAAWDADLVHMSGVRPLHRVIHMGLLLDADLIAERARPLADGLVLRPLSDVPDVELAALSPEPDRLVDLRIWRDLRAGSCGPLMSEASLAVTAPTGAVAAVAVTEHRGVPLVGHLVSGRRGGGMGRAALSAALSRLLGAGYGECHLHVAEDNWIARRLYRSLGFAALHPPSRVSIVHPGGGRD